MERRGPERYDASSTIQFRSAQREGRAHLSDLSLSGCRLSVLDGPPLERGTEIDLQLVGGVEVRAMTCWAEGAVAGLRFAVPINMAMLAYFRFAEGIVVPEDADFDRFGRRLPPLGSRTGSD